jgi:hypothetical protein
MVEIYTIHVPLPLPLQLVVAAGLLDSDRRSVALVFTKHAIATHPEH